MFLVAASQCIEVSLIHQGVPSVGATAMRRVNGFVWKRECCRMWNCACGTNVTVFSDAQVVIGFVHRQLASVDFVLFLEHTVMVLLWLVPNKPKSQLLSSACGFMFNKDLVAFCACSFDFVCYTVVLSAAVLVFMCRCNHYRSAAALIIQPQYEKSECSCTCVYFNLFRGMDFTHGDGEFFFFPVVIFLGVLTNRVVTSELQATIIDVFKVVVFLFFLVQMCCGPVASQTVQSHNNLQSTLCNAVCSSGGLFNPPVSCLVICVICGEHMS